jgi:hypothetical protein
MMKLQKLLGLTIVMESTEGHFIIEGMVFFTGVGIPLD